MTIGVGSYRLAQHYDGFYSVLPYENYVISWYARMLVQMPKLRTQFFIMFKMFQYNVNQLQGSLSIFKIIFRGGLFHSHGFLKQFLNQLLFIFVQSDDSFFSQRPWKQLIMVVKKLYFFLILNAMKQAYASKLKFRLNSSYHY